MASRKITQPIKWHGGKGRMASKIVEMMPSHTHYVEPYAGGLSVLLAKDPEGVSEVVNDLDFSLTNFWRTLQGEYEFKAFCRYLSATPFSEVEWLKSSSAIRLYDGIDVRCAVAFFIRCRQSLAGRMDSFCPLSRTRTRRGMNEQASSWLTAIEGLPEVHERLKRVVILNHDATDVIKQQDGHETLFYLDPPYMSDTRASTGQYEHEMTNDQHSTLLCALKDIKGRFMLSGYRSDSYDAAASMCGWNRVDFDLPNNAAGGKTKRRMTECVWMNYDPATVAKPTRKLKPTIHNTVPLEGQKVLF